MSTSYRGHRLAIDCPHCGERARVRSSRKLTSLVRAASLQCSNVECGHTFGAQFHITHTIAPSHLPNPDVVLPIAVCRMRSEAANDTHSLATLGPPVVEIKA
jgi:hypothetical protein